MKKGLCLFTMLLLLLMSAGCGQTAAQIPEIPVTEASKTDVSPTTVVEPNEEGILNADASEPDNAEYDSLPGPTSADINDNDFNIGESDSSALPEDGSYTTKEGRSYTECDIDTLGTAKRGAKRIVFSNDGLIYYTEDHYKSFELLYGEADP